MGHPGVWVAGWKVSDRNIGVTHHQERESPWWDPRRMYSIGRYSGVGMGGEGAMWPGGQAAENTHGRQPLVGLLQGWGIDSLAASVPVWPPQHVWGSSLGGP